MQLARKRRKLCIMGIVPENMQGCVFDGGFHFGSDAKFIKH